VPPDLQLTSSPGRSSAPAISPPSGVISLVRASANAGESGFLIQGDRDALMARYSHLTKFVVGRLRVSLQGVFDREDAMQAGTLGLLRAIDAYKPDSEASFESYAIVRIRGSILDAVRALDPVGRAGREFARSTGGTISRLHAELERVPTASEIAERLGISVNHYHARLRAASVITISLDQPDSRDDGEEQVGIAHETADLAAIDPESEATRRDDLVRLAWEIGRLSSRQQVVLSMYYSDEMTFREIGKVLGLTESRICQIHATLLLALRTRMVDPDFAARVPERSTSSKSRGSGMVPMAMLGPSQPERSLDLSAAFEFRDAVPPAA
jgi:RNA polymerase sigma factor for flagellar operon FliA